MLFVQSGGLFHSHFAEAVVSRGLDQDKYAPAVDQQSRDAHYFPGAQRPLRRS